MERHLEQILLNLCRFISLVNSMLLLEIQSLCSLRCVDGLFSAVSCSAKLISFASVLFGREDACLTS
jgi:hypothetical protein